VANPPELFYNDPKSHSFEVVLALQSNGAEIDDGCWKPIEVQLLYERGELVDNQSILEPIDNPGRMKLHESTAFRFRISQVSRNHLNRRFRLRFRLVGDAAIKVETHPIMVLSKEASKRSRGKKNSTGNKSSYPASKRSKVEAKSNEWVSRACSVFKDIAWQKAGYESYVDSKGVECMDRRAPIFRCVCCGAMASSQQVQATASRGHLPDCKLNDLLKDQNTECESPALPPKPSKLEDVESILKVSAADFNRIEIPDATSMAHDLQDILQIPAESFCWLQEDLESEDSGLSECSEQDFGGHQASPQTIRFLQILAGICRRLPMADTCTTCPSPGQCKCKNKSSSPSSLKFTTLPLLQLVHKIANSTKQSGVYSTTAAQRKKDALRYLYRRVTQTLQSRSPRRNSE